MKLRILGSGTILGGTGRNCSGYLLDGRLLVDCGPGIWSALYKRPKRGYSVDTVLVSHFHFDHVADLAALLFARYVSEAGSEQRLLVYGPTGAKARLGSLLAPHGEWLGEVSYSVQELTPLETRVGDYTVRAMPTAHTSESLCFRITDGAGASLFYSGDAAWNEDLVTLARSCRVAIVEAALPSHQRAPDHLTPSLAGRLAAQAKVETLILTHCYPQVFTGDPIAEAAAAFGGKILLARDGLEMSF